MSSSEGLVNVPAIRIDQSEQKSQIRSKVINKTPPFSTNVDLVRDRTIGQWRSDASVLVSDDLGVSGKSSRLARPNTSVGEPGAPNSLCPGNDGGGQFIGESTTPDEETELEMVGRSLPTVFQAGGRRSDGGKKLVLTAPETIGDFLTVDLDLTRLNKIHSWLWMAGRPLVARALHRHKMLGRTIVVTEQADMHLMVDDGDRLFIKPLPLYLVSHRFWARHICGHDKLFEQAAGLVESYVWLIRSEHDFAIAVEEQLLPRANPPIRWQDWKQFVTSFRSADRDYNRRYLFGELRLARVNSIYRLAPQFVCQYFLRGYLYGYNRYSAFFQRRIAWLLILFVWLDVVMSSMQVGISLDRLSSSGAFIDVCYGFSIFSICLVLAVIVLVGFMFGAMYITDAYLAIRHSLSAARQKQRKYDLTSQSRDTEAVAFA